MNVDDVGQRAGTALRERFDHGTPPALQATVEPSERKWRSALVGSAAVLIVVLAVVVVASRQGTGPANSHVDGAWKRITLRRAFGARANPELVSAGGPGFVAVGSVTDPSTGAARAAAWSSTDGQRWTRSPNLKFGADGFTGYSGLAAERGVLVAASEEGEIWRSTDGVSWRLVAQLRSRAQVAAVVDGVYLQKGLHGFVAVAPSVNPWVSQVWTSRTGEHWTRVQGNGSPTNPVGLLPGAQLGSKFLTLSQRNEPQAFDSRDGVHWSIIPAANTPERLALPLASNHTHSKVLGIQFEHIEIPNRFGGRLWSTTDGKTWTEIESFHHQMPVASPDHLVQLGRWWVIGGNTGTPDGKRRASMWTSPDLRRWYEMPVRLRGPKTDGVGVPVIAGAGRVVGIGGKNIWIWVAPR